MTDKSSEDPASFWTKQEKLQLKPYRDGCEAFVQTGFNQGDVQIIKEIGEMRHAMIQIKTLLQSFKNHEGKIKAMVREGEINRNQVYGQLEQLVLEADDFRPEDATVETLLLKSKWGNLARRVVASSRSKQQGGQDI